MIKLFPIFKIIINKVLTANWRESLKKSGDFSGYGRQESRHSGRLSLGPTWPTYCDGGPYQLKVHHWATQGVLDPSGCGALG